MSKAVEVSKSAANISVAAVPSDDSGSEATEDGEYGDDVHKYLLPCDRSVFEELGDCGLISFNDYVFMLTVRSLLY